MQGRFFTNTSLVASAQIALLGDDNIEFDSILNHINAQKDMPHYRLATRNIEGRAVKAAVYAFNHKYVRKTWTDCPNPAINVAVVFFDLTSEDSFEQSKVWINRIKESSIAKGFGSNSPSYKYSDSYVGGHSYKEYKIILVGTKADTNVSSVITDLQVENLKSQFNISEYKEVNTTTGENIEPLLQIAMQYSANMHARRKERLKEQTSLYMRALVTLNKFHNNSPTNIAVGILLAIGLVGIILGATNVIGLGLALTSVALTTISTAFFANKASVSNH